MAELDQEKTFEGFVVDSINQAAHYAALSVANRPKELHNPLWICGWEGMGKTHLLHAIGNEALKNYPHLKIKYLLARDVISAEREGNLREVDIILIDDMDLLREERIIIDFLSVLKNLLSHKVQIVVAIKGTSKEGLKKFLSGIFRQVLVTFIGGFFDKDIYNALLEKQGGEHRNIITQFTSDIFSCEKILIGGMGKVYIGRRQSDGNLYALKTIRIEEIKREDFEKILKRFRWESQVWIIFGRHRNIVQAHWFDQDKAFRPLLIMEYVEGDGNQCITLRDWLKRCNEETRKLPLSFIFRLSIEVLTGLLYCQRVMEDELNMEFCHRDLKPENILITRDGTAKVTDFGLVKAFEEVKGDIILRGKEGEVEKVSFFATRGVCGTPPYMAPEQWLGKEFDERTDVYGLGCVLYEMITGRPPFIALDFRKAHLNNTPMPPVRQTEEIPEALRQVVLRCLAKEKSARPKLGELRNELQMIQERLFGKKVTVKDEGEDLTASDWNNRGNGFAFLGLYQTAISCFKKAMELSPGNL